MLHTQECRVEDPVCVHLPELLYDLGSGPQAVPSSLPGHVAGVVVDGMCIIITIGNLTRVKSTAPRLIHPPFVVKNVSNTSSKERY